MVEKLIFVAKETRPDLLPFISFLTTRVLHATEEDQDKLRRGLRYLNGTKSMGIRLWSSGDKRIRAYIDASYGTSRQAEPCGTISNSRREINLGVVL